MKTTFKLRNNRSRPLFRAVAFSVLSLALGGIIFFLIKGPLVAGLSPFWSMRNKASTNIASALSSVRSKDDLIAENTALKKELEKKELLLRSYDIISIFTPGAFRSDNMPKGIRAKVLLAPPMTPYDVLLIDKGASDGVAEGHRVGFTEGAELGVITRVFGQSSEAELFSSAGKESAAVLERNEVRIALKGRGSGNAEFEVPREIEVVVGDRVLSTAGIFMAVVGDIKVEPTDSLKQVIVRAATNIQGLNEVEVFP